MTVKLVSLEDIKYQQILERRVLNGIEEVCGEVDTPFVSFGYRENGISEEASSVLLTTVLREEKVMSLAQALSNAVIRFVPEVEESSYYGNVELVIMPPQKNKRETPIYLLATASLTPSYYEKHGRNLDMWEIDYFGKLLLEGGLEIGRKPDFALTNYAFAGMNIDFKGDDKNNREEFLKLLESMR